MSVDNLTIDETIPDLILETEELETPLRSDTVTSESHQYSPYDFAHNLISIDFKSTNIELDFNE